MVGASVAVALVVIQRTPKRTTFAPGAHATTSRTIGRGTSALTDSDLRREQNQIVRIKWVGISVTFTGTVNVGADTNDALIDGDTVTGSDGVSDPSGHSWGHWKLAHRGRSRHRSSCDTDPWQLLGRQKTPPVVVARAARQASGTSAGSTGCRFNGLEDGFRMGGRQQGDPDEAD
jgi:hypothetical protein